MSLLHRDKTVRLGKGEFLIGILLVCVLLTPVGTKAQGGLQARLDAKDGMAFDYLGASVCVNGNSLTAGAPGGGSKGQGAVYLFTRKGLVWTQTGKLTAADGGVGDGFGSSVRWSGNLIAVSAPYKAINRNAQQGAVYVFSNSGSGWKQIAELTAADGTAGDLFGVSVGLCNSGLAVGAPYKTINGKTQQGSVYVFSNSGSGWKQIKELTPTDGIAYDNFGSAVDLSGSDVLVGAPQHIVNGQPGQGAVYDFNNAGISGWVETEITASDGSMGDGFGSAISLSNTMLVISAPFKTANAHPAQGVLYTYTSSGAGWSLQSELTASDGAAYDYFGWSVCADHQSNRIVASAPLKNIYGPFPLNWISNGVVYLFAAGPTGWIQTNELSNPNIEIGGYFGASVSLQGNTLAYGHPGANCVTNFEAGAVWASVGATLTSSDGAADDGFGDLISRSGNLLAVSAPNRTVNGNLYQGAVYLFTKGATGWTQTAELTASDGAANDKLGEFWMSLSGNVLAVGAPYHTVNGNSEQGAVYLFTKGATGWTQTAELTASDGATDDSFGWYATLSGNVLAVRVPFGGNLYQGVVYLFTNGASGWTQTAELTPSDGAAYDSFGSYATLSGNVLAVSAPYHTVNGNSEQGAVYLFTKGASGWTQTAELTASDGAAYDNLGGAGVNLSGNVLAVSAPYHTVNGNSEQGAVYLFTKGASGWTQTAELTASDGAAYDGLGLISLSGNVLVANAPNRTVNGNPSQGAIYLFTKGVAGWTQTAELTAKDGGYNDSFGSYATLSGKLLVVPVPFSGSDSFGSVGRTYLFGISAVGGQQLTEFVDPYLSNSNDLTGGELILGCPASDINGNEQGAIFIAP